MKHILIAVATAIIISSCACGSGSQNESALKAGNRAVVIEKCLSASNEDAFKEMVDCCVKKDERGLELMEAKGLIRILEKYDSGVIIEAGFSKTKIRLLDDTEVWVANEFIQ